jgi:hypothetical protein
VEATLKFQLPEDQEEHMLAVKAGALAAAVVDFERELRNEGKHGGGSKAKWAEHFRLLLWEHLNRNEAREVVW